MSVCVLLPVYNNRGGAIKTLMSLLQEAEAFKKFFVLIVDDGKNGDLLEVINNADFPFDIFFLKNEENVGIVTSLNRGIQWLKERNFDGFLARIDAGDECINHRIITQYKFLKSNPHIGLVGSHSRYVSEAGKFLFVFQPPTDPIALKRKMKANNFIMHPSIMMRFSLFEKVGVYSARYPHAEDYDLFTRVMRFTGIANIGIPLINYEVSSGQISNKYRRAQLVSRARVQIRNFEFFEVECWKGVFFTLAGGVLPWDVCVLIKSRLRK